MYLFSTSILHVPYSVHSVNHSLVLLGMKLEENLVMLSYGIPQNQGLLSDMITRRCNSKVHDDNLQTIYPSSFAYAVLLGNQVELDGNNRGTIR